MESHRHRKKDTTNTPQKQNEEHSEDFQVEEKLASLPSPAKSLKPDSSSGRILQLQRTIGNKATQRLLADHKSTNKPLTYALSWINTNPELRKSANTWDGERGRVQTEVLQTKLNTNGRHYVQRYEEGGSEGNWRTSANGKILYFSEHEVYATSDTIEAANEVLAGAGSFIRIQGVNKSPLGNSDLKSYRLVQLTWEPTDAPSGEFQELHTQINKDPEQRKSDMIEAIKARIEMFSKAPDDESVLEKQVREKGNVEMGQEQKRLEGIETGVGEQLFITTRDCHQVAQMVMGATRKNTDEKVSVGDRKLDLGTDRARETSVAHRAVHSFLKFALPDYLGILKSKDNAEDYAKIVAALEDFGKPDKIDLSTYTKGMAAYKLIQASELKADFNKTYKINEFVEPVIGQALTQVNDENERAAKMGENTELWNFHWAGVIMRDGADYLTLQAVADAQKTTMTYNWYFKLYGSGSQSFHEEEKKDDHVGESPITLGVSNVERPRQRRVNKFANFQLNLDKKDQS